MSTNSIIEHRANYYYVQLQEDFLRICETAPSKNPDKKKSVSSPYCKALILSVMESWTNSKRGNGRDLWVSMSYQQWMDALYHLFGRMVIIDSLSALIDEGFLSRETFKMKGRDSFKYLLNYKRINERLAALPEQDPHTTLPKVDASKNGRVESTRPKMDASKNGSVTHPKVDATHPKMDDDPSKNGPFIDYRSSSSLPHTESKNQPVISREIPLNASSSENDAHLPSPKAEDASVEELEALLAEWKRCHEEFYRSRGNKPPSFRVSQTMMSHGYKLISLGVLPATLPSIVSAMLASDTRGWYAEKGLYLGNVVRWVEEHPIPHDTPRPTTMNRGEAIAFARSLAKIFPGELLAIDHYLAEDKTVYMTCLRYGEGERDWLSFGNPDDYEHPSSPWYAERIEAARLYGAALKRAQQGTVA